MTRHRHPSRKDRGSTPRVVVGITCVLIAGAFAASQPSKASRGDLLEYLLPVPVLLALAVWLVASGLSRRSRRAGLIVLLAAVVTVVATWWWLWPSNWGDM